MMPEPLQVASAGLLAGGLFSPPVPVCLSLALIARQGCEVLKTLTRGARIFSFPGGEEASA